MVEVLSQTVFKNFYRSIIFSERKWWTIRLILNSYFERVACKSISSKQTFINDFYFATYYNPVAFSKASG